VGSEWRVVTGWEGEGRLVLAQKVNLSCTAVCWCCADLCCMTSKHWYGAWVLSVQSRLPLGGFCKGFVDTFTPVASCCLVPGQSCGAAVL
jgi:hypothetical protein